MVNEELLFRGLPWGINIDEARALLNLPDLESLQLKDAVSSQYSVYGFQGHRVAASANSHYKNKGLVHQLWRWYSDEDSRPRIAEKMLEAIYLFFANVPKGNKLSYSDSDTCLYAATYYFAPERESFAKDAAYIPVVKTADGLIEKLNLLYGAPDKVDEQFHIQMVHIHTIVPLRIGLEKRYRNCIINSYNGRICIQRIAACRNLLCLAWR